MGANFSDATAITPKDYTCGWCGRFVASARGWLGESDEWGSGGRDRYYYIALCPKCRNPTYVAEGRTYPAAKPGEEIQHLPDDVASLYAEARASVGDNNYNAAVLLGRKLLMHVAVEKGAGAGKQFGFYVGWLLNNNVVTADMKDWVDEIREFGNEANHEIVLMGQDEAEALMGFVAMLLQVVYEYPERGRRSVAARKSRGEQPGEEAEPAPVVDFDGGYRPPPTTLGSS